MKGIPGLRRFFRMGAFRPDPRGDLEEELAFHFQRTEEELRARGLSPSEARAEAFRRFGDLDRYRKQMSELDRKTARRSRWSDLMDALQKDLGYVLRGLARSPGFTLAVVLTLALGIGANATMFGVVDRLLLSPPAHVTHPEEVARLQVFRESPFEEGWATLSYMSFADYQDFLAAEHLAEVAAFGREPVILGREDEADRVSAVFCTPSFFSLLGVVPQRGRLFHPSEGEAGRARVAVLSHGLWQRRFGGRESVLGTTITVGDGLYTVVGITPKGFNGVDLEGVDLYLPIHAYTVQDGADTWASHRGYYWIQTLARISPATSRAVASQEATALHLNGRSEYLEQGRYPNDAQIVLGSIKPGLGPDAPGEVRVARWLAGVALIVLLIACANVANLLLARGSRRQRELGIRVALGVSRRRLVGHLLLESFVLAGLGAGVGLAVAYWGGQSVRLFLLPDVAWLGSPVDGRVLLVTTILAMATGLLAGLAPAFKGTGGGVVASLREGSRGGTHRRSRAQTGLLVSQAALSVVLLMGAGLFVRSIGKARSMDLGLDPRGLMVATLDLEGDWDPEATLSLAEMALERVEALPGVTGASFSANIPFWGMSAYNVFVPEVDSLPVTRGMGPFVTTASPAHLSTLGIQLREGRMFTQADAASGARLAVITENMAEGIWGTGSALGKCLMLQAPDNPCWEVIGVVEASRLSGLEGEEPWQYYLPFGPPSLGLGHYPRAIFIRARGDTNVQLAMVRRELQAVDPAVRFAHVRPLQDLIDPELRSWELGATLFTLFGALALLVAAVGLYSVLAFHVARRTREMGVRSAIGAPRGRILGLVLRQALGVTSMGVALGLLLALFASYRIAPLLFETSPRDPVVMAGVAGTMILAALLAGAIPAWNAARVDPMEALRAD